MRSPLRIYREWKRRRFMARCDRARIWAEGMNAMMNTLPQEQQDQLDARLRDRFAP